MVKYVFIDEAPRHGTTMMLSSIAHSRDTVKYRKQWDTVPAIAQGRPALNAMIKIPVIGALGTGLVLYHQYGTNGYQIMTLSEGELIVPALVAPTKCLAEY